MTETRCTVCSGTGKVHYLICGVEIVDSCPVCASLGIIPLELHDFVEVQPIGEVRHDRV